MPESFPLFCIYRHYDIVGSDLDRFATIRQTVVFWTEANGFSFVDRDLPVDVALFDPDISHISTSAPRKRRGSAWRNSSATQRQRHDRIIRVAFYDVRHRRAPVLVLDSVGVRASKLETTPETLYLRVVLRNAVSPHERIDLPDYSPASPPSGPFAELDFQGPVFAGVLRNIDQDIQPGNPHKTTANFARLVVADKDFANVGSPARYQPRGAAGWSAQEPNVEAPPPPEFNVVPPQEFDPGIPPPPQPLESSFDFGPSPIRAGGGSLFAAGFLRGLHRLARNGFIRAAVDEPVQPRGTRPTTRVADLVGHYYDGEAPQWFAAGAFTGDEAIPFARALGIDSELVGGELLVKVQHPEGERFSLDNPHWARRMRVVFERGPGLPGHPAIRTIEVSFTRAFGVRRDIFLSNTDAATLRTQLPVTLYLKARALRPAPPRGQHPDCQQNADQYRFVQRQPPLWCCETVRVVDPVRFLVALEEVTLGDAVQMWNRDVAGRYLGAIGSVRSDRRISFFPRFRFADDGAGAATADDYRFSLMFGLRDTARMFGEPERFDLDRAAVHGLSVRLWRLEPGTQRDAHDRALAELFVDANPELARANALHDALMLLLLDNLDRARASGGKTLTYARPERLHFRSADSVTACRSETVSRPEFRDAIDGVLLDGERLMKAPPPRFDVEDLDWPAITAYQSYKWRQVSMEFETPLFVDSAGAPLRWQGLFTFLTDPPAIEGSEPDDNREGKPRRSELRLHLTDLRMMAGLAPDTTPTGPRDGDGPLRPPFLSFSIDDIMLHTEEGDDREPPSRGADAEHHRQGKDDGAKIARLGAYDLEFDPSPPERTAGGETARFVTWLEPLDYHNTTDRREFQVHTEFQYTLPVRRATPGAQDDVEGADLRRSTRPLVVALHDETAPENRNGVARLALEVSETAYHLSRQRIRLALYGHALPAAQVVVIDTAPLFIAKIAMDEVTGLSGRQMLAEWDSDRGRSATWRVSKQSDGYDLVLPSPAVGETVARDRGYGLKVFDVNGKRYENLADFRLSPPVTLRLGTEPRFGDLGAVEPPFNTRRIFGTAQDRAPYGAPLFHASFELLYGMTANVQGTFGLVLREIGSDIGRAPLPIDSSVGVGRNRAFADPRELPGGIGRKVQAAQEAWTDRLTRGWSKVLAAVEARPAVLSMRNIGHERTSTVATGLDFALRPTADIAAPVDLDRNFANTPYAPSRPREENGVRTDIWGAHPPLEGGADAGFESANIYRELWETPTSVSGELTDVTLTAFGAAGAQRATFSNGKQRIISRASQGRTHFYSLERVGRIATYWNRCKHVIVYERTTSATVQFAQSQPELRGRPVLRKVREYVEILEPMRAFPEDGAHARRCGPVLGLRFDAMIIPVDSAWGSDVGAFGWKLPLYQPGADGYVPPPIDFEMAIDPRAGSTSRLCRCRSPERIFFYSSALPNDGEDTNAWAKVPGVDYCIEPPPRPPMVISHHRSNIDRQLPSAEEVPLGYELFTQIIDTADGPPIDLGARRTGKPMVATLSNITVTRGALPELAFEESFVPQGSSTPISKQAGALLDEARRIRGIAREGIEGLAWVLQDLSDTADATPEKIEEFLDARREAVIDRLGTSEFGKPIGNIKELIVSSTPIDPGSALCRSFGKDVQRVARKLCDEATRAESGLRAEIDAAIALAEIPFGQLERTIAQGLAAKAEIDARLAEMQGVIADLTVQLTAVFPGTRTPLHDALKRIPVFRAPSLSSLKAPLERAVSTLDGIKSLAADIDAAETRTLQAIAEAKRVLTTAQRELDGVSRASPLKSLVGKDGPIAMVRIALSGADRILVGAERSVTIAFDEARQSDRNSSDAVDKAFSEAVNKAKAAIVAAAKALDETAMDNLATAARTLEAVVKALKMPFGPNGPDREEYKDVPADLQPLVQTVRRHAFDVVKAIDSARNGGITALIRLESALDNVPGDTEEDRLAALKAKLAEIRRTIFTRTGAGSYVVSGEIVAAIQREFASFLGLPNTGSGVCRDLEDKTDAFHDFCGNAIGDTLDSFGKMATEFLTGLLTANDMDNAFDTLKATLQGNINDIIAGGGIEEVKDTLLGALDAAAGEVDAVAERALAPLRDALRDRFGPSAADALQDTADAAVRLYRAFGDPPKVPALGFNRETLGYFFDENTFQIDTTPVAALFDRVGGDLKGLGLRVPMTGLTERLLPNFDKDFKISDLFPDIGGIKLDKLLEGALVPDGAQDYVNITHGIDKESRTGWIDATVEPVTVSGSEPLFELFGLAVHLNNGSFSGAARQEIGLDGQQVSRGQGKIEGDWKLRFGGYDLVTFQRTPLSFDQTGKFDFAIAPDRVALAPELSFLDKFLNNNPLLGGGEAGFTVGVLQEGLVPVGVECLLDLPVPPMIYGTTGVTGMRLIAGMQLRVVPEFAIVVHAAVGSIETPFTITIFILGGTGWIQTWGQYTPRTGELRASVSVAVGASAMLGFSFGPINGAVQVVVAIKGQLITSNQARDVLSVSLLIICTGQVDVAGLISAALLLVMELRFEDQGRTIYGNGTVSFRIRISRFFTYRISQSVTYKFAGSSGQNTHQPQKHVDAVV